MHESKKRKKRKKIRHKKELPVEVVFYSKKLKDSLHSKQWSNIKLAMYYKRKILCHQYESIKDLIQQLSSKFRSQNTSKKVRKKRIKPKCNPFFGNSNEVAAEELNQSFDNYNLQESVIEQNKIIVNHQLTTQYQEENTIVADLNNIIVNPVQDEQSIKKDINIYDCNIDISNITCYSSKILLS